jgi:hypothetical protein
VEDSAVGEYHSGAEPELALLLVLGTAVIVVGYRVRARRRRGQVAC